MQFDDVFSDVSFKDGLCVANISDSDYEIAIRFSREFTTCVLFTPPHREAVCVEPYTCLPDGYNLQAKGAETGLRVLEPQESFEASVEYCVSKRKAD